MEPTYLWEDPAFPHFYYNPAVVAPLEEKFQSEIERLDAKIAEQKASFDDVLTEEILSNSEIEGVLLDRASVQSSFVENILPAREKEQGAVALTKMAVEGAGKPVSHDLLFKMHREILKGSTSFPAESVGIYVGDMKIVSGNRMDREHKVIHEGVCKALVHEKMTEFIEWSNHCSPSTPLANAVQGHLHFETLHPFCDGNGRIGRSLSNLKYQKMTGITDRTALRDLNELAERGLLLKTGELKGTRYFLNTPHIAAQL